MYDHSDSHFVFKFHGNRPPGTIGETMRCLADKTSQNAFFSALFCANSAEGANSLHGSVPRDPTEDRGGRLYLNFVVTLRLPVKFRSNRFRFAGIILEKVKFDLRPATCCPLLDWSDLFA